MENITVIIPIHKDNDKIKIRKEIDMKEELERDMTPRLIGETYLRKVSENSHQRYTYGLYECQYCGTQWECRTTVINRGVTKSCGCLQKRVSRTHGLRNHRMYGTWINMLDRCYNKDFKHYAYYGGRGIKVCGEWLDIKNFVDWVDKVGKKEKLSNGKLCNEVINEYLLKDEILITKSKEMKDSIFPLIVAAVFSYFSFLFIPGKWYIVTGGLTGALVYSFQKYFKEDKK